MDEISRNSRKQGGLSAGHVSSIEKFIKMNSPAFSAGTNHVVAENWVQKIEKVFAVLQSSSREAKIEEFLNLKQGQQTVQQYAARFIELSHFASYIIPYDTKKVQQFERGMRREIYKQMSILKLQDFAELVDRATMAKAGERLEAEKQRQKKRSTSSGSQQGFSHGSWKRSDYYRDQRQELGNCGFQSM
ncbi:uncharacterized protein LOC131156112 [Malania oleifera]|uniref:uncharacterized protein LOC131156112 n=1 Tax=Malania oleifera TaxID=397392 RepID=UPI0025AE4E6F|nr:uncharacterized protein LOC131156112 [Malania oleifera]